MNGEYTFHPGIVVDPHSTLSRRARTNTPTTDTSYNPIAKPAPLQFLTYEERRALPPAPGKIRLLCSPAGYPREIARYWNTDMSLSEWVQELSDIKNQYKGETISSVLYPPNFLETLHAIFLTNQRERFLVRKVYRKWTQRVWMKRTQCNITLIDMEPVEDRDAVFVTDTKHHQIFRFHRNDVFKNFLTNIGSCDEMLPSPRAPTNPWTNEPLTLQQTMTICNQMILSYAEKGKCPPLLFSAFCAARYNIRRFRYKFASLLSQHAITTYFAEITPDNRDVIEDTISQLLYTAGCLFSPNSLHRWINMQVTPLHREWLSAVCDYTLYMNLHIQVRPFWYNQNYILQDIRRMYDRSYFFRDIVRPGDTEARVPQNPSPSPVPQNPNPSPVPPNPNQNQNPNLSAQDTHVSAVTLYYDTNQLLGLMLASELEGTLSELIHNAQLVIDEQPPSNDNEDEEL